MSLMPIAYDDPRYSGLAAKYEGMYGLPKGILDAIRTLGERSNANQVSEAGAKGVYQFIEPTRRGIMRNYGVDPYAGPEQATQAAALLVKENHDRSGSWDSAVKMYHGGLDHRNWGKRTRAYASRVGSFDQPSGAEENMPIGPSIYPKGYYGQDPLAPYDDQIANAPEPPKLPVPIPGDPGPSANVRATSPIAKKKRGGVLGALESVFMPEPDSLWAGALRDGIWNAKESQKNYRQTEQDNALKQQLVQENIDKLHRGGEIQVIGNNAVVRQPDGSWKQLDLASHDTKLELFNRWMQSTDPTERDMLGRILLGGNSDPVLQSKENQARTRAGATVQSARIRATAKPNTQGLPPLPPGQWKVVK